MSVASGQWHTLRVDFSGNHFTVTFDGKKSIEWEDDDVQGSWQSRCLDEGRQRDIVRRFHLQRQVAQCSLAAQVVRASEGNHA